MRDSRGRTVLAPLVRVSAAAMTLCLALAGCTSGIGGHGSLASPASRGSSGPSSPSAAPPPPTQPRAHFTNCRKRVHPSTLGLSASQLASLHFDCAVIGVPLDYDDPGSQHIGLQLIRVRENAGPSAKRSLLVNPGGPGASGTTLAVGLAKQLRTTLLRHFDVIGFDPRGVGSSTPIRCQTDAEKDKTAAASPDVLTPAGFAQAKRIAGNFFRACADRYNLAAVAQFNTTQTARDMDQIRQAVGDRRLDYFGYSYGTELGAQYAYLFPSKVGVMVLDGAVDPTLDPVTAATRQNQGFEDAFDQFAGWCHRHSPCSTLGNPRRAVYRTVDKAKTSPIPTSTPGDQRHASTAIVLTGVLSALYSKSTWPLLGTALIEAGNGDARGLFTLADEYNEREQGHYTNIADANTTIGCDDQAPGPSDATIRTTARSWAARFPLFGRYSAPALFTCQQWHVPRTPIARPTAPSAAHTILVVGNIHDPATPYPGAKDLTATLGHAELLTWNGEGHTSYLDGSHCVDTAVNAYLENGTLPHEGTTCPR